jgi:hypothetical protein
MMNSSALRRAGAVMCVVVGLLAAAPAAVAQPVQDAVSTFTYTQNMHPQGFSARAVPLDNTVPGQGRFNSDLAFWGRCASAWMVPVSSIQ